MGMTTAVWITRDRIYKVWSAIACGDCSEDVSGCELLLYLMYRYFGQSTVFQHPLLTSTAQEHRLYPLCHRRLQKREHTTCALKSSQITWGNSLCIQLKNDFQTTSSPRHMFLAFFDSNTLWKAGQSHSKKASSSTPLKERYGEQFWKLNIPRAVTCQLYLNKMGGCPIL